MNLQVCARSVYGQTKIYPVNVAAETLSALIGKKTFSTVDLQFSKQLGHTVEVVADQKLALAI